MIVPRASHCRLCGWAGLTSVLHLGTLAYCGVFPSPGETVPKGPLELVTCDACGLVQMAHVYPLGELYGDSYGYRSGLNATMVSHLGDIAREAWHFAKPRPGEAIVDIGANDGTLLGMYPDTAQRWAFDPLAEKYRPYYAKGIHRVASFFEPGLHLRDVAIVTSIACFYDLPDPIGVAQAIADMLRPGGVWSVEVADLDAMVRNLAFDQIVHEHVEFYSLHDMREIGNRVGLALVEWSRNDTNGGSFRCVFQKGGHETGERWHRPAPIDWASFEHRIAKAATSLETFLLESRAAGRNVWGYGASTKGNVLLQMANVTPKLMDGIFDANPDKAGAVTPGTGIPIHYRADPLRPLRPELDVVVVFPWHFRDFIIEKERDFVNAGGTLVFPLPTLEQITR